MHIRIGSFVVQSLIRLITNLNFLLCTLTEHTHTHTQFAGVGPCDLVVLLVALGSTISPNAHVSKNAFDIAFNTLSACSFWRMTITNTTLCFNILPVFRWKTGLEETYWAVDESFCVSIYIHTHTCYYMYFIE